MNTDLAVAEPAAASFAAEESTLRRLGLFAPAMLLIVTFFWTTQQWWVPAHGGVDQNGYLVGGKQLALTGSMALRPRSPVDGTIDPFQFVGKMWVAADLGTPNDAITPNIPSACRFWSPPASNWAASSMASNWHT